VIVLIIGLALRDIEDKAILPMVNFLSYLENEPLLNEIMP
jgi:hypothetical protein